MRKNYIIFSLTAVASSILLMASSGGRNDDRTGAPSSDGNCASCHSGGTQNTTVTIGVTEKGQFVPLNSYQAGKTYTIAVAVGGISTSKGFQATVLNSSNQKTGTTANASVGSQIISANNRDIASHTAESATGLWTFEWTAPASPSGSVTIYASGNAANNNSLSSGDQAATTTKVLTLDNSTGTRATDIAANLVYPNPCTTELHIPQGAVNVQVTDMGGKIMNSDAIGNTINTSSLSSGIYFVSLNVNGNRVVQKFIKD